MNIIGFRQWLSRAYHLLPLAVPSRIDNLRRRVANATVHEIESGLGKDLKLYKYRARSYISGTNEQPVQRALAQYLKPGDVFFDIGANIGFFTLIGARIVGSTGAVYAFEPVPKNVSALNRNITLNRFTNVTILEKALSDISGVGELLLTEHPGGATLSSSELIPPDVLTATQVEIATLDELLANKSVPSPDLVKIDVEGAEVKVLRGMEQMLKSHKPIIIYEIDDSSQASFTQRRANLDSLVSKYGYTISRLEDSYPGGSWHVGHAVAIPVLSAVSQ